MLSEIDKYIRNNDTDKDYDYFVYYYFQEKNKINCRIGKYDSIEEAFSEMVQELMTDRAIGYIELSKNGTVIYNSDKGWIIGGYKNETNFHDTK